MLYVSTADSSGLRLRHLFDLFVIVVWLTAVHSWENLNVAASRLGGNYIWGPDRARLYLIDIFRRNAMGKVLDLSASRVHSLHKCLMKTVVCVALSGVRCRWSISNSLGFPSGCIMTGAGDWLLWSSDWTVNKQCCVGPRLVQWLSEDAIRRASKQIFPREKDIW